MLNADALTSSAAKAVLSVAAPFRRGGAAAGLPQRVRILSWGENIGRTTGARILVDDVVAARLSRNQELVAIERVPMDYEHQSVKGHPNYHPDPRHSPGAGIIEVVPGEGVYLSAIDYSPSGEAHAPGYQDVSAVVHLDADGRPLWVSSVALTQTGDVAGMEFAEAVAALSARSPSPTLSNSNTESPKPTTMENDNPHRALLITLLGLKPGDSGTITDEEITAAVEKKTASSLAAAEMPKAESTEALSAVTARLDTMERNALVERATREGKVIPLSAELISQTPVAILSAMIDGLKAGEVPLKGKDSKEIPADRVVALSADEANAARQLGLTEEEYRAAK